jgi:O-methyltransferase
MKSQVDRLKTRVYRELRVRRDAEGARLAEQLRAERLTFLGLVPLLELRSRVLEAERKGIPGAVIEAGCALGGSAILLALSKSRERELFVHDTFATIPPPSPADGPDVHARYAAIMAGEAAGFDGDTYYGYQPDLKATVSRSFERFGVPVETSNVRLVEGLFEDTVHPVGPVAVAHIDGDWYESTKVCLERIWPQLPSGGVAVIDDYGAWSGCRTAVDEFLVGRTDVVREERSRLHLVKR